MYKNKSKLPKNRLHEEAKRWLCAGAIFEDYFIFLNKLPVGCYSNEGCRVVSVKIYKFL